MEIDGAVLVTDYVGDNFETILVPLVGREYHVIKRRLND